MSSSNPTTTILKCCPALFVKSCYYYETALVMFSHIDSFAIFTGLFLIAGVVLDSERPLLRTTLAFLFFSAC